MALLPGSSRSVGREQPPVLSQHEGWVGRCVSSFDKHLSRGLSRYVFDLLLSLNYFFVYFYYFNVFILFIYLFIITFIFIYLCYFTGAALTGNDVVRLEFEGHVKSQLSYLRHFPHLLTDYAMAMVLTIIIIA